MADKKPVDKTDISLISKDYQEKINALNYKLQKVNKLLYPVREKVYCQMGSNITGMCMQLGSYSKIAFTYNSPPSGARQLDVSLTNNNSVVAWVSDQTLNISGFGKEIFITSLNGLAAPISNSVTNVDFTALNTSECTNFNSVFQNCSKLTQLNLSNFNVESVETANYMFSGCTQLKTIYADNWSMENRNISSSTNMFTNCTALSGFSASSVDWSKANYENGYFTDPALAPSNGNSELLALGILGRLERLEGLLGG